MTTSSTSPDKARQIAKQLLLAFDGTRPHISLPVIESLRQMVDETKHQDPQRAMRIANVAMAAAACLNDPLASATASWAKATAHVFLFELGEALNYYRLAEENFRAVGALLQRVSVQSPQIYVLNALGDATAALALADEVRPHCHVLGQDGLSALVNLEMNVGTVLIQRGQYQASLAACDRATTAAQELGDAAALARIDINRANVYQELDHHNDAERCYQRARKTLTESHQNRQQVALVDLNLGLLALRRGDYWQALQHLERAHDGYVSPAHLAWVDFNRALVYHRLNLTAETVDLAARAVDALSTTGSNRELAMALQVWASAAEKQNAFDEAEQLLLRASRYFNECGAPIMAAQTSLAMAALAKHNGKYADASALLTAVRQAAEQHHVPSLAAHADLVEIELSMANSWQSNASYLPIIERAVATLANGGQSALLLRGYRLWAKLLAGSGDRKSALGIYQKALNLVLDMRHSLLLDEFQIAFLEEHLPIFLEAAALHLQAGENLSQVAYLLALATTTPEQHRLNQVRSEATELSHLRNDWHWQQSKIEKLMGDGQAQNSAEVEAAQQRLHQIEVQIADGWRRQGARSHVDNNHTNGTHLETLSQQICHWTDTAYCARLQASLTEDEAYLHYFVIEGKLHVLVVRRHSLACNALGATTAVDSALRAWRHHLRDWSLIVSQPEMAQQIAERSLRALYKLLFQPIVPHLAGAIHLNFMLPPQWSDLPLAALLDGDAPLIEGWTLSQLVSPLSLLQGYLLQGHTQSVADAAKQPLPKKSLLVGLAQQTGLSQTAAELVQISASVPADWTNQLLQEDEATLENVRNGMADCDLLHIASHASFRADNPLFSWLQLADGRLTVADLYHQVRLNRQPLTVLSACETARGQHSGLLGVARALLAVGAGELIATQWKVEDHASAQLMGEFYRGWFATPDSPDNHTARTLAAAQRNAAQTLHPALWAGFVNIR